jgi:hypothetical protein
VAKQPQFLRRLLRLIRRARHKQLHEG